jgi:hypothetical protein
VKTTDIPTPNSEVRIKLSLCLTKNYAMETYGGVEIQFHAFITSETDGGEWSAEWQEAGWAPDLVWTR